MKRFNARVAYNGAITEVRESVDTPSGNTRFLIRIISPGQGSCGVYEADNLAASVGLFKAGTHMFMDHPSESENWDRPERSVKDLAGKLVTDAFVGEDGALYAECEVYPSVAGIIRERMDDIGVSINAWTDEPVNEADGIVPVLSGVSSVDFVTKAGAGGAVLELLECERPATTATEKKEIKMSLDDIKAAVAEALAPVTERVTALEADAAKKKADEEKKAADEEQAKKDEEEKKKAKEADEFFARALDAAQKVAEADLPEAVKARVLEAVRGGADVDKAIETEARYMESVRGTKATKVIESGSDRPVGSSAFLTIKK